jgi:hypothetical protein
MAGTREPKPQPNQNPMPFSHDQGDPLAEQHRLLAEWTDAPVSREKQELYWEVNLKDHESGQRLLNAKPPEARSLVVAAVAQARYWGRAAQEIVSEADSSTDRVNPYLLSGWPPIRNRLLRVRAVIHALMRRSLPFERDDLLKILSWCYEECSRFHFDAPLGAICRAVERYLAKNELDEELAVAIEQLATALQSHSSAPHRRHGAKLLQLSVRDDIESERGARDGHGDMEEDDHFLPPPQPAFAGSPGVLTSLKRLLGMIPTDGPPTTCHLVGPDQFPLGEDSPLKACHEQLTALLLEILGTTHPLTPNLRKLATGRAILKLDRQTQRDMALAIAERSFHALTGGMGEGDDDQVERARSTVATVFPWMIELPVEMEREGWFDLLLFQTVRPVNERGAFRQVASKWIRQIERKVNSAPLTEGERYVLSRFRSALIFDPPLGTSTEPVRRLTKLLRDRAAFCLVPGEEWSDGINDDFSALSKDERKVWAALWSHALTAVTARPAKKWLRAGEKLVSDIGHDTFRAALQRWLPLVSRSASMRKLGTYVGDIRGRAETMHGENAHCLRGVLWLIPTLPEKASLIRHVTSVALSAYKKVPGVGPRAVKVGNAAVYALSAMGSPEAVGQLALLKVRIKTAAVQKEIEKALNSAAEQLAIPRDQIEEMSVPSYELEPGGTKCEKVGDYEARIVVTGSDARLHWFDSKGKQLKSVPAKIKRDHQETWEELRQNVKDIQGMLPAQRDRLDGLFLADKSWGITAWRERYLEHPLMGTIASRLLWCIDGTPALFRDGVPTHPDGRAIEHGKTAEVTIWHPAGRGIEEITAWRRRLEEARISQPFKQAHREVYLLTDAERRTRTYSNRFAAHVIRQHQFNALCAARGWKNKLRLLVDDEYAPPYKELPRWGLRAEFWVESIGEDYGTDTNASGVFLRLATDQVRFYRMEAAANLAHASGGGYRSHAAGPGRGDVNEPLPLEDVPPLVFSEIMRDVDLFVGVASVGNDPTWQDGGPDGRFRDYWQSYSFGKLSGTATTRKEVLQRLVPRLKIADRCSFADRFLVVRGDKRTYKIHLGSGNILMEPNDQYLCIVPDSRSRSKPDDLFLPFEGDNTLSIVLSKAFLLADDTKIKDPTITRQIDGV